MSDHGPADSSLEQELRAQSSKKKRGIVITAIIAVIAIVAVVLAIVLTQRAGSDAGASGDGELVQLKIADSQQSDYQDEVVEVARDYGLDLEFVIFDDPYLPNSALMNGEVDVNNFQHLAWMSTYNAENDADLTPLFTTVVSQWGLYSDQYADVDELPDSPRISVPEDPANFARSLFILEDAGLLQVDPAGGLFATEEHITDNPLDIEFVPLAHEAVHTAYTDPSIDAIVATTDDFDPELGVEPGDALYAEDATGDSVAPYAILAVTTEDREDEPVWDQLKETYHDPRVIDALEEEKQGRVIPVDVPREALLTTLDELDEQ